MIHPIDCRPSPRVLSLFVLLGLSPVIGCSTAAPSPSLGFDQELDQGSNTGELGEDSATQNAEQDSGSSLDTSSSKPLCEEGQLRECQALPSGEAVEFPSGVPLGNCQKGHQRCESGQWSACKGTVGPQGKDSCEVPGDDADCDGVPNQGCTCIETQGPRPCGQSSTGACELGTQSCRNGAWQECVGEIKPVLERCDADGVDEDCDGLADLADPDCDCINGTFEACALPRSGDCGLGKRTCQNGVWGRCEPRFPPSNREDCAAPREDSLGKALGDEDCDGQINNNPGEGLDPVHCAYYMIDEDQDGYGAIGKDFGDAGDKYSYGCFCPDNVPNDQLVPAPEGRHNSDCGDCALDEGALVHPGAEDFHKDPSACLEILLWESGAYDYNCDGKAELQHDTIARCEEIENRCETKPGFWHEKVPGCGQPNRIGGECEGNQPPCASTIPFKITFQKCR